MEIGKEIGIHEIEEVEMPFEQVEEESVEEQLPVVEPVEKEVEVER